MISDCTVATSSMTVVVVICPSPLFAIYVWIISTLAYNVIFLATVYNVMSLDPHGYKLCLTISYSYNGPKYFKYLYHLSTAEPEVVNHAQLQVKCIYNRSMCTSVSCLKHTSRCARKVYQGVQCTLYTVHTLVCCAL